MECHQQKELDRVKSSYDGLVDAVDKLEDLLVGLEKRITVLEGMHLVKESFPKKKE